MARTSSTASASSGRRRPASVTSPSLGVRTRPFSFANRGLDPPAGETRSSWTAPIDVRWEWGDEAASIG